MHALLIDDSHTFRFILGNILRRVGFEISEAGCGKEALERLQQWPMPDLVTIDWNMPGMTGVEVVRAIRAVPTLRDLPLVMVTSETHMSRFSEALAAGANEYIMKPFTDDTVFMKLEILGFPTI